MRSPTAALLFLLGLGCGASGPSVEVDAGTAADSGALEDASVADAGDRDAGGPDLVGVIMGACGELDDSELLGPDPSSFENEIDFPNGYTTADLAKLSLGAQEILADGTAGGSSGLSEAFSFEVLHRCEGAALLKSETEVVYDVVGSKKTDILVEIDAHKIGVSVTRAVGFPRDAPYTVDDARVLIERKFSDILMSSANVSAGDRWTKQMLHVIAYSPAHADSMRAAALAIDPTIRADTILWITVTNGDDAFIY